MDLLGNPIFEREILPYPLNMSIELLTREKVDIIETSQLRSIEITNNIK